MAVDSGAVMFMAGPGLTPRQKAAVVVRLLLTEGAELDLSSLPGEMQALLAQVADPGVIEARFVAPALSVQGVQFIGDLPSKHVQAAGEAARAGGDEQAFLREHRQGLSHRRARHAD